MQKRERKRGINYNYSQSLPFFVHIHYKTNLKHKKDERASTSVLIHVWFSLFIADMTEDTSDTHQTPVKLDKKQSDKRLGSPLQKSSKQREKRNTIPEPVKQSSKQRRHSDQPRRKKSKHKRISK